MIKIVTSKETDKVKNLPKEVKSDIEETLKLLDCMYGVERHIILATNDILFVTYSRT